MPLQEAFVATISAIIQNRACFEPGSIVLPHLTPVDEAAHFIVQLSQQDVFRQVAYHIANPTAVTMRQLFQWIQACGYELRQMQYPAWRDMMFERPSRSPLQLFERLFPLDRFDQRLLVGVGCEQTVATLARYELRWSGVDQEHIRSILASLDARGALRAAEGDNSQGWRNSPR
jgi:thioester reductase-like protein